VTAFSMAAKKTAFLSLAQLAILICPIADVAADPKYRSNQNSSRQNDIATRNADFAARLLKMGKYREALVPLDEAIKAAPGRAQNYVWRGRSLLEIEHPKQAMVDLNKAIELDPNNYLAYQFRARGNFELGNFQASLKDYTTALDKSTAPLEKADILRLRARVQAALKRNDLSIADFTQSISFERHYSAFMLRGNQYCTLGKYEQAVKDYSEALKHTKDENVDRLYTLRAQAYEKMGRKDLAQKDFAKAKEGTNSMWGSVLQDLDKNSFSK